MAASRTTSPSIAPTRRRPRMAPFWSRRWDSNPRPATYEAAALPAELRRPKRGFTTLPSRGMGTLTVERLAHGDYALIKPLLVDLQEAEQAHYEDHPQLARWEIEDQL